MKNNRIIYPLFLWLLSMFSVNLVGNAQSVEGDWEGIVWQENSTDTFIYQLRLRQGGEALTGQATSTSSNGKTEAEFMISGRSASGEIRLQEVEQIRPASPLWCLKYIQLSLNGHGQLTGEWTATGCKPGKIRLSRLGSSREEEIPFGYPGRWTGHLSQSDREYGFFFELELEPDGGGTSYIVSEGAGGEARHQLRWEETSSGLRFEEARVAERTDPNWKWCLKSGRMTQSRNDGTYQLEGDWEGFLEHKSPVDGACAPGTVFLTKPVLTKVITEKIAPQTNTYTENTGRSVKVDRVLKVRSHNIRIRVWDNGIVDGDVLTLFLNGKQILHKYRVNKRRWSIPVEIIRGENLLILHADDLGDISPNTVAVAIDDGIQEQIIVLSSNLRESGAILIQPFDYKE